MFGHNGEVFFPLLGNGLPSRVVKSIRRTFLSFLSFSVHFHPEYLQFAVGSFPLYPFFLVPMILLDCFPAPNSCAPLFLFPLCRPIFNYAVASFGESLRRRLDFRSDLSLFFGFLLERDVVFLTASGLSRIFRLQ